MGAARVEPDVVAPDAPVEVVVDEAHQRGIRVIADLVVNLDQRNPQEGVAIVPAALGLPPAFTVRDLLAEADFHWRIGRNYVRLEPGQSHILHVQR